MKLRVSAPWWGFNPSTKDWPQYLLSGSSWSLLLFVQTCYEQILCQLCTLISIGNNNTIQWHCPKQKTFFGNLLFSYDFLCHFCENGINSEAFRLTSNDYGVEGDSVTEGEKSVVCSEGFQGDGPVKMLYLFCSFIESFFRYRHDHLFPLYYFGVNWNWIFILDTPFPTFFEKSFRSA